MEPAPDAQQHPAMPDPARVVTRSLGVLRAQGYGRANSLIAIQAIVRNAIGSLRSVGIDDLWWLEAIAAAAERMPGSLTTSQTDTRGQHHADGSSSSTSRDTQIGPRGTQG